MNYDSYRKKNVIFVVRKVDDTVNLATGIALGWLSGANAGKNGEIHFLEHVLSENRAIKEKAKKLKINEFNASTSLTGMVALFTVDPFANPKEMEILEDITRSFLEGIFDKSSVEEQRKIIESEILLDKSRKSDVYEIAISFFGNSRILGDIKDIRKIRYEDLRKAMDSMRGYLGIAELFGNYELLEWIEDIILSYKFGKRRSYVKARLKEKVELEGGKKNYILFPIKDNLKIPFVLASCARIVNEWLYWFKLREEAGVYAAGMGYITDVFMEGPMIGKIYFSAPSTDDPKKTF